MQRESPKKNLFRLPIRIVKALDGVLLLRFPRSSIDLKIQSIRLSGFQTETWGAHYWCATAPWGMAATAVGLALDVNGENWVLSSAPSDCISNPETVLDRKFAV